MDFRLHNNMVRTAGAILGVGIALALLLASRPAANGSPLPATARVGIAPTGELEVTPPSPHPVLVADALRPGGKRAGAAFLLRNQTGRALALELRTSVDSSALDGLLRLRLSDGRRTLADTTLQGMRQRPVSLRLASGARARMRLEAWIPREVLGGYEGRLVRISLVPGVRIPGGRR
jgi:hypothetical protein